MPSKGLLTKGCSAALLSGVCLGISFHAAASDMPSVVPSVMPSQQPSDSIRIQLEPAAQLVVSSELAGRLQRVPFKEGQHFAKGDVIASIECDLYQAKYQQTLAQSELAQQKYQVAKRLNTLESNSVLEVGQASADFAKAKVEQRAADIMVKRCAIRAPFAGRVSERMVEPGEFVSEGTKLLNIYSTDAYDVEMIVPSRWVTALQIGQSFTVQLDETGQTYPAKVTRLGSVIDALSQSFKVFGEIQAHEGLVLMPGMSGSAQMTLTPQS